MKCRLALVDARCDAHLLSRLGEYAGELFLFRTQGITYESVSCHPDVFLYQDSTTTLLAPNAPQALAEKLASLSVPFRWGDSPVGESLRDSSLYNCVSTDTCLFHRKGYTDEALLALNRGKRFVELPQSYTRCSMFPLSEQSFITSDAGIHHVLLREGFSSFLFSPEEIRIPVHRYGFLGGTCGRWGDRLFFLGNPLRHRYGPALLRFVEAAGLEPVSLSDGYLYDGGGVFFW